MDREYLSKLIDNLINLRTTYFSIGVVVSSGIISLFYNISILNLFLLVLGLFFDCAIILNIIHLNKRINKLLKFLRGD